MKPIKYELVRDKIGSFSLLFTSILYLAAGLSLIFYKTEDTHLITTFILIYGFLITLGQLGTLFQGFKITKLILAFLPLIFAFIVVAYRNVFSSVFVFLLGAYLLMVALFRYIDFYFENKNKVKGRFLQLFITIIMTIIALPMLFDASMYIDEAFFITGIFCIFYGIMVFKAFFFQITPKNTVRSE